jgi:general secretion pathway protein K
MKTNRRGTALLAVLWLSAALGAIDRALLYIEWGPSYKDASGAPKYFQVPMPVLRFEFPTGSASVEIIPESAKLNINASPPPELGRLMQALGVDAGQAQTIVAGIMDWRSASPGGSFTQFDQHYLSLVPSFRSRHASFQEIEELLLVQGVTPDLFYGSYTHDADGKLAGRAGLRDCLSVFGTEGQMDVNTMQPEVMQAIGINPGAAAAIVAYRNATVIKDPKQISAFVDGSLAGRLGVVPTSIATLRSTARLRLSNGQYSDVRRTVGAMVKFIGPILDPPYHVLRWYDTGVSVR